MSTIIKYIAIASFVVLLGFVPLKKEQNSEWVLKKNSNDVSVFTRDLEDSDFKELKSVTQLKTSLSSVVALLNDWENYPKWVYKCGKSLTIKKVANLEVIHYQTVIAPWPADNRDFVVDVKINQDPLTKVVIQKATCLPDFIPKLPDHVRITEFKASWTLTPLKNGMINIEYQLLVNPGGSVPAWIINLAVVDGPFETMVNMRDWVKKDTYQKASLPFITEPE
jgi:ribosome-associated toxin RatA of RatAB toxin-antitoxin module